MKEDKIRKHEMTNFAEGEIEDSDCPYMNLSRCLRTNINCNFGLTEIQVPIDCPLRRSSIHTHITLIQYME